MTDSTWETHGSISDVLYRSSTRGLKRGKTSQLFLFVSLSVRRFLILSNQRLLFSSSSLERGGSFSDSQPFVRPHFQLSPLTTQECFTCLRGAPELISRDHFNELFSAIL